MQISLPIAYLEFSWYSTVYCIRFSRSAPTPIPVSKAIAIPISIPIPIRRRHRSMLVSSFVLIVRFSTLLCIFPFIHAILLLFPLFSFPPAAVVLLFSSSVLVRPVFSVVSRCRTLIAGQRPTHVKVAAAYPFFRFTQIVRILFFGFFYFLLQSFAGILFRIQLQCSGADIGVSSTLDGGRIASKMVSDGMWLSEGRHRGITWVAHYPSKRMWQFWIWNATKIATIYGTEEL